MKITKQESRVLLGKIFYSKEQGMDDDWMEGYLIEQIELLSKLHQHDVVKNEVAVCDHKNEVMRQGDGFVYVTCKDCGQEL